MEITPPTGVNSGKNPYLYSGKELDRMHGLNQYDFTGRWLDNAVPGFTTPDPLAESHYSESPYLYCGADPVDRVDPSGLDWYYNDPSTFPTWYDTSKPLPGYKNHSSTYVLAGGIGVYYFKSNGLIQFERYSCPVVEIDGQRPDNQQEVIRVYNDATSGKGSHSTPSAENKQSSDKITEGLDLADQTLSFISSTGEGLAKNGLTRSLVINGTTIGRYAGPAGHLLNAAKIGNSFRKDGYRVGRNTVKTTSGVIGGWAGALAGFKLGTAAGIEAGFEIGLYFEGVGAIPGAAIGGFVGGIVGAVDGAYVGGKVGESIIP